jgi:hypothetical protein
MMHLAGGEAKYAEFIARLAGVEAKYAEFIAGKLSANRTPCTFNAPYDHNFLLNGAALTFHLNMTVEGPHDDAV